MAETGAKALANKLDALEVAQTELEKSISALKLEIQGAKVERRDAEKSLADLRTVVEYWYKIEGNTEHEGDLNALYEKKGWGKPAINTKDEPVLSAFFKRMSKLLKEVLTNVELSSKAIELESYDHDYWSGRSEEWAESKIDEVSMRINFQTGQHKRLKIIRHRRGYHAYVGMLQI
jgi:hypothetical protein